MRRVNREQTVEMRRNYQSFIASWGRAVFFSLKRLKMLTFLLDLYETQQSLLELTI